MPQKLKALFKGQHPSVHLFKILLDGMPQKQQLEYRHYAYELTLNNWLAMNKTYRVFLINLVQNDRQAFLNYLKEETILGQLCCPLTNVTLFIKWMNLWNESQRNYNVSNAQLAFALLLTFDIRLKVNVLRNYLATYRLDTDELVDLYKYVRLANIDDC